MAEWTMTRKWMFETNLGLIRNEVRAIDENNLGFFADTHEIAVGLSAEEAETIRAALERGKRCLDHGANHQFADALAPLPKREPKSLRDAALEVIGAWAQQDGLAEAVIELRAAIAREEARKA